MRCSEPRERSGRPRSRQRTRDPARGRHDLSSLSFPTAARRDCVSRGVGIAEGKARRECFSLAATGHVMQGMLSLAWAEAVFIHPCLPFLSCCGILQSRDWAEPLGAYWLWAMRQGPGVWSLCPVQPPGGRGEGSRPREWAGGVGEEGEGGKRERLWQGSPKIIPLVKVVQLSPRSFVSFSLTFVRTSLRFNGVR